MAITFHGATYAGVSGDTKPSSNLSAGDLFVETNTDKIFQWNGSAWDAVTVADTSITFAKMAVNSIDSDQYVDGSIDLAHMSSQSVDEDNLYISNSGTNGQFLSKESGDNGGLTWATPASNAFAFFIS